MWQVQATAPTTAKGMIKAGWDYPQNYFPRKFHYKRDALKAAETARQRGGLNIAVERVK